MIDPINTIYVKKLLDIKPRLYQLTKNFGILCVYIINWIIYDIIFDSYLVYVIVLFYIFPMILMLLIILLTNFNKLLLFARIESFTKEIKFKRQTFSVLQLPDILEYGISLDSSEL